MSEGESPRKSLIGMNGGLRKTERKDKRYRGTHSTAVLTNCVPRGKIKEQVPEVLVLIFQKTPAVLKNSMSDIQVFNKLNATLCF